MTFQSKSIHCLMPWGHCNKAEERISLREGASKHLSQRELSQMNSQIVRKKTPEVHPDHLEFGGGVGSNFGAKTELSEQEPRTASS
jgi:hypothetical protein